MADEEESKKEADAALDGTILGSNNGDSIEGEALAVDASERDGSDPVDSPPAKRSPANKRGKKQSAKKAGATKSPAKKTGAKKSPAKKAGAKKTGANKSPAKKSATKKSPAKKAGAEKAAAKKAGAEKAAAKKSGAKKSPAKKAANKSTANKSTGAKKAGAKKAGAEKSGAKKAGARTEASSGPNGAAEPSATEGISVAKSNSATEDSDPTTDGNVNHDNDPVVDVDWDYLAELVGPERPQDRLWILDRIADLVLSRPKAILAGFLALLLLGAIYGRDVATSLSPAGYQVSDSESTQALAALAGPFQTGPTNFVVLVDTGEDGGVFGDDTPQHVADVVDTLNRESDVADVYSYWSVQDPRLRSSNGRYGLITARIVASEEEQYDRAEELRTEIHEVDGELDIMLGGTSVAYLDIVEESERDLLRAELLAIPITTLIMLLVFRSVIAALLPLIVAAIAVIGTAVVLKGLSEFSLVSIFGLNLTTALGLGMAVDYSLFTISRWREERAAGASPNVALRITINRAGRSVLFSGLTTAATLAALLLFDYPLFESLAVAGFAVVLLATVGALVALPAAIALLGDRVDRYTVRRPEPKPVNEGRWYRFAQFVMAHPKATIVLTVGILLVLAAPFRRAEFSIPDDRALPETSESRQVADVVRAEFEGQQFGTMAAVAAEQSVEVDDLISLAETASQIGGVAGVETVTGIYADGVWIGPSPTPTRFLADPSQLEVVESADEGASGGLGGPEIELDQAFDGVWLAVLPSVEPISGEAEDMVAEIRSIDSPIEFMLGGESARLVDNKAEIRSKLVPVVLWVIVVVALLLYWSFGSVVLPLKAIVLNMLSLTAAFGAIVWIFQDGHFSGLLGFTPTGLTDAQTPILVFCIAFGLSMDYEVFLLSRIKEEWEQARTEPGLDPDEATARAVAVGLQRTGGIITAAAVLMAGVFLAFATGNVVVIQLVGIGLALSIIADATLVRSLLVPAFMVVAGRWNWIGLSDIFGRREPSETDSESEPDSEAELESQPTSSTS